MLGRTTKKKGSKELPALSTASLPDIIFMLLFFFMVVTVMREKTPLVRTKVPEATELVRLEKKSWVVYIYIGPPVRTDLYGTAPRIQLNDAFGRVDQIIEFVENERAQRDERVRPFLTYSLKVDRETSMGIVTDVKQELRKANALKINYSAVRRKE